MEPEVRQVAQQYLAAVREHTTNQNLATKIRELLTENAVYTFLHNAGIQEHSHNVFVYWDDPQILLGTSELSHEERDILNTYRREGWPGVIRITGERDEGLALPVDQGIVLEVGVQVFAPFIGNARVICSSTPSGRVATLFHRGSYAELGTTHRAILDWCQVNHHPITGLRWEIYGRWNDDPSKLETQVFYLLQ